MEIKPLKSDVISKIRSSAGISTVAQCVFELVCNSLDAKSTSVAVRVNLIKYRIQVADNGDGITKENMNFLGTRYATNKCYKAKDLEKHLKTYGFRGESLANILEMSRGVNVTSRLRTSEKTYSKTLSKNVNSEVRKAKSRPSPGTTVTVLGWLSTVPVRQQRIDQEIEIGEVKKQLESLVIINPGTSFTLRNDVTGLLILNSPRHDDILETFRYLHPEVDDSFTLLKVSKSKISIELLINKKFCASKKFQYIYANKRPVLSGKIAKHLCRSLKRRSKAETGRYPVYVMHIKCPQTCVDNLLKPAMCEVQFTCWNIIMTCVDKLIKAFEGDDEKLVEMKSEKKLSLEMGVSQLRGAVQACAFKKKKISSNSASPSSCKIIMANTQTTGNYQIEDSGRDPVGHRPKRIKSIIKKSLAIQVRPIEEEKDTLFDQRSVYSKLNTNQDEGKDLIMDMFLKSTQIYKGPSDCLDLDFSKETVEESNYFIKNKVQDHIKGINTTMSISVNVKKKRTKSDFHFNPPQNRVASKCVQTTQSLGWNRQKSFQTELSRKLDEVHIDDNYTILMDTISDQNRFVFKRKSDEIDELEGSIEFRPMKICRCKGNDEKMFDFRGEKKLEIDDNPVLKEHEKNQLVIQSPYFTKPFRDVKKPSHMPNSKEFRPAYGSTRVINEKYKNRIVSPYFMKHRQNIEPHECQAKLKNGEHSFSLKNQFLPHAKNKFAPEIKNSGLLQSEKEEMEIEPNIHNQTNIISNGPSWNNPEISDIFETQMDNIQENVRSPNIFTTNEVNEKPDFLLDVNNICNLADFGLASSKNLEISLPDSRQIPPMWSNQSEKSKIIIDSQNQWLKQVNERGNKYFVNSRTGMVTAKTPAIFRNKFDFDERTDFVPKGMSPVLIQHNPVKTILSENAKKKLSELILEGYDDELMTIKWKNCDKHDPKTFFRDVYKDKSKQFETCIPNVYGTHRKLPLEQVSFSRKLFATLKVLGQVDRKFIAVIESAQNLLVLFDQHAAHERIRLELLLKEYKGTKSLYQRSLTIFLSNNNMSLLKHHFAYLDSVGLGVEFFTNGIHVTHIPSCLKEKFASKQDEEDLHQIVNRLVNDILDFLKQTRGSHVLLPKIILELLNMKACRGAIKFGDKLSKEQCEKLLQDLARCSLPFQCAHGRPTLTPILFLDKSENAVKVRRPVLRNLWHR